MSRATTVPGAADCHVLYVGDLSAGSTAEMRLRALEDLGYRVTGVNSATGRISPRRQPLQYIAIKMRRPLDMAGVNRRIRREGPQADILWIDKGVTIRPHALRALRRAAPRVKIVGFSPDDMLNANMSSHFFRQTLPLYDLYLTTKSYNVAELTALGCPRTIFVPNAYDPATHRPLPDDSEPIAYTADVGFIGTFEPDRAGLIERLAEAGVPVVIRGNDWQAMRRRGIPGITFLPESINDDYARALRTTRINLAFLRKSNRDLQTTRSIEIPACGGFMLAERTDEHRGLFAEGLEAEYFEGTEEMISKAKRYLADEPARQAVARAGRERCLNDDYSYAGRLRAALAEAGFAPPHPAHG
ncbi:MAG: glycosyltransferase [Planctomycetota bacterium]